MRYLVLQAALLVALGTAGSVGAEMFKCVEDGRTVYQDRPCRGTGATVTVVPANQSGVQPPRAASPAPPPPPSPDSSAKLRDDVRAMELDRRQRELEHEIGLAQAGIDDLQAQRDRELARLQVKKNSAKNNLAGATWEQSISAEMQAVSDTYKTRIDVVRDRLADLRRDLAALRDDAKAERGSKSRN